MSGTAPPYLLAVDAGTGSCIFTEAGGWVSITSPARLLWLARHRPDILGRIGSLGMLSDWIVYRVARVKVPEPSLPLELGHVQPGRPDLV